MQMFRKVSGVRSSPFLVGLCVAILVSHCSEEFPAQPQPTSAPEISDMRAPEVLFSLSEAGHTISVRVHDPQGLDDIADVGFEVVKAGETQARYQGDLFDDGFQGDVIAGDGSFSTTIKGSLARGDSGAFEIRITALDIDGHISNVLSSPLFVLNGLDNQSPQILSLDLPQSVAVDSTHDILISARVADLDGLATIRRVWFEFFPPQHATPSVQGDLLDGGVDGDVTAGDGIFSALISSNLFTELTDYIIRIQAEDASGNLSLASTPIVRGRQLFSQAPEITALQVPRIVNANVTNEVTIRADVTDPEGLADIDSVLFRIVRISDGTETADSPVVMADDGNLATSGDSTAGDGRYSARLPLQGGSGAPVELLLDFKASDVFGATSLPAAGRLVQAFDDVPYISNLVAPNSVIINPNAPTRLRITLDVRDPQNTPDGSDIVLVKFHSFLPSGLEADNSPTPLFDHGNGAEGDRVAGDGIYSVFINLPATGVTPGDFRFVFSAQDRAGAESNVIEHIMTVRL